MASEPGSALRAFAEWTIRGSRHDEAAGRRIAVFWRWSTALVSWLAAAFAVLLGLWGLLSLISPNLPVADVFAFAGVVALAVLLVLVLGAKNRVEVRERGLLVVNSLVRYWIPWSEVRAVDAADDVAVRLRDGSVVKPTITAYSMASSLSGRRLQNAVAEAAEQARKAARGRPERPLTRTVDVPWRSALFLAVVLFAAATTSVLLAP
ncbi:hypothetical protein C1701_20415 [Actinoalloteichus sp. AHMU CJ021]|uniref:PH domain-containing protein n=1 Tax=Actinoalloteichus caeruleus DSM 43889 TaxID=1120930 RepID=A0ABT1JPW4_ACTCY|nr:hypothetical protein [Actinoalloteichus caeruleus]AUS80304.1 hypothetical protein C1701_20415 [Actinoalloteichus sp. AHMU CJ021]MCP2334554.1 hypothetical protein [Actinoalloteichus caeruleus DSM 43889]